MSRFTKRVAIKCAGLGLLLISFQAHSVPQNKNQNFAQDAVHTIHARSRSKIPAHIVEYKGEIVDHSKNIEDILCDSSFLLCQTSLLKNFSGSELSALDAEVSQTEASVINFSFAFQFADYPSFGPQLSVQAMDKLREQYQQGVKSLTEEIENIRTFMIKRPNAFFAIAAGNGYSLKGLQTAGIALGGKQSLYPADLKADNNLIVAAATENEDGIEDYSNFGLIHVDVAAPVLKNKDGKKLRGTSYASPYVAKVAGELMSTWDLSIKEVKEILLKSCKIPDVPAAIAVSVDYLQNGENSKAYHAMYEKKRKIRESVKLSLGQVLLVRCGGILKEDLAKECANVYFKANKTKSITQACLQSHDHLSSVDRDDLLTFWKLRNL